MTLRPSEMMIKIAIDGPAGSGKSSTAKLLSKKLNLVHINSGNLYRAITYVLSLNNMIDDLSSEHVRKFIESLEFDVKVNQIFYKGDDIINKLHNDVIDKKVCIIAQELFIREKVNKLQRSIIDTCSHGIVIEGRDIGTKVMPDANVKIFLTADSRVRAERRHAERPEVTYADTLISIERRDFEDKNRAHGPLVKAKDAIVINNSDLGVDETVSAIMKIVSMENEN